MGFDFEALLTLACAILFCEIVNGKNKTFTTAAKNFYSFDLNYSMKAQ